MIGAGRYDSFCTTVREANAAEGAVVIVIKGKHGSGFSVQGDERLTLALPALLRAVAEQIEHDIADLSDH